MERPYRRFYNEDKDILSLNIKIQDNLDIIKLLGDIKKLNGIIDILSFEKTEKFGLSLYTEGEIVKIEKDKERKKKK